MRIAIAILASILLYAAHASADEPKPELADETLVLRWQRDVARAQAAESAIAAAQRDLVELRKKAEASRGELVARHNLQPGDDIPDAESRVIKRAPKPPATAPPAKQAPPAGAVAGSSASKKDVKK